MQNNKEQFRNFVKSFLVYMAVDTPPTIEYGPLDVPVTTALPDKPKTGNDFNGKKNEALATLKNIHLDANLNDQTDAEKKLAEELKTHIGKEFQLLEHNYQEELDTVGRGPENQKANEARNALNKAADNFVFKLEMHVLQRSIEQGDTQGKLMAQIRLIDGFTQVPGFGQHFIEGNPTLAENLIRSNPKNREEFNAWLNKMLDSEGNLERGIVAMIKKTPNFREMNSEGKVDENADNVQQGKEKAEFARLIGVSRGIARDTNSPQASLLFNLGTNNWEGLQLAFTRRFYIKFQENSDKPDHYVDLMDNNRVYKPNEINGVLLRLSQESSFRSPNEIAKYNKQIDKSQEAQTELYNELLRGFTWSADKEVTGLSTLRNNPRLNSLIQTTATYENSVNKETAEINAALAKFNGELASADNTAAVKAITKQLTPDYIKSTPALQGSGALVEILALVRQLAGNSKDKKSENSAGLSEVSDGVKRGENPSAEAKKSKERYKENLPKASVTDLLEAYINPKGEAAKKLFKKAGESPDKNDQYAATVLPSAIEEHFKTTLGYTELLSIKKTGDVFNFNFKKGEALRMFTIEAKEGKLVITDLDHKENPKTVENTQVALKQAFEAPTPATPKTGPDALPTGQYIDANGVFKDLTKDTKIHNILNPTAFEEVVITLGSEKNRAKSQTFIDTVKEIKVVPKTVDGVPTYVIAAKQPHAGERLFVYNGDIIKSVKRKTATTPVASTK